MIPVLQFDIFSWYLNENTLAYSCHRVILLLPQPPPPTRAISQWASSLEWRHAVTLHILVGKICISFLLFNCEGMLSLLVLWLCDSCTLLHSVASRLSSNPCLLLFMFLFTSFRSFLTVFVNVNLFLYIALFLFFVMTKIYNYFCRPAKLNYNRMPNFYYHYF